MRASSRRIDAGPVALAAIAAALLGASQAQAVSSYAIAAEDAPGSATGAAAVALGVPDYQFVNDLGAGFGGTNADVFGPGESTVLSFAAPIRNVPGRPDLRVSAFVGGSGASDDAQVQVEVSSDGVGFTSLGSIATSDGRSSSVFPAQETGFASVKHFALELGAADRVTHVRLTNVASTAEGLRLDAIEGLWPETRADHAFEIRFERYRGDEVGRFLVRIKNLARAGGVPIRELRIDPSGIDLENTGGDAIGTLNAGLCEESYSSMARADVGSCESPARLLCIENCVPDNWSPPNAPIPYTRLVWSADGETEAAAGEGLDPGLVAANLRMHNFDTDPGTPPPGAPPEFLPGYAFTITFADGATHGFDFDGDVLGQDTEGAEFQKYIYFNAMPALAGPRPVHYYEFVPEPASALGSIAALGALAALARRRRDIASSAAIAPPAP